MSSRDDKADAGEIWGSALKPVGIDVSLEVVYAEEGKAVAEGDGLGDVHPHQEGAGETGSNGNGDAIKVAPAGLGLSHRFLDDGDGGEEVLAGGNLGDDAAVSGMNVHLRGDDVGQDLPPVLDNGGCCFVAGGLDAKELHFSNITDASLDVNRLFEQWASLHHSA